MFLNFFLRFLGDLVPVLKAKNLISILNSKFTFSTGTKSEKYLFFAFRTGTKSPRNRRKKFKKSFFGYLYRSKYLNFGLKQLLKNFGAAFGTWDDLQKKYFLIMVVPGAKYGVFRYKNIKVSRFVTKTIDSF
jgi:hypothetical protein